MPTDPIGQIPVEITGDYSPLEKAFEEAKNLATKWAGQIAEGFNSGISHLADDAEGFKDHIKEWVENPLSMAKDSLVGFIESIGPLGLAASVGAAGLAILGKEITNLVTEEGAAAEAMTNFAARINLPFEEAKKLSEMAEVAGISIDSLSRVSMRLADALEDPAGAGKKVDQALHDMGISATNSGEALLQMLQKLSEIPDATERINKAHEIMGRSAIQLEPLLRDYAALGEAIDSLGGKLEKEGVDGLLKADDAAKLLSLSWRHLKEELAATFSGPVTAGLELLTKFLTTEPKGTIYQQIANLKNELAGMNQEASKLLGNKSFMQLLAIGPESEGLGGTTGQGKSRATDEISKQIRELESLAEAQERSKEYNDILDKNTAEAARNAKLAAAAAIEAQKKAAEAAKQHAIEVAKANEQYRILFLGFQGVDDKLQGIKNVKFTQSLFPLSWLKEQKEQLDLLDKLLKAVDLLQDKARSARDIKLVPVDVAQIKALGDAVKLLGNESSEILKKNMTEAMNAYNEATKSALFTNRDLDVIYNKILVDKLKIAEADAGTKDLTTRLQLETRIAEVTGASATAQITQLENIKLHTESLMIATHALGDLYVDINESFTHVFDNLDKGLTKLLTGSGSLSDMLKNVAKSFEQDIVGSFVHAFTQGLKKAFLDSGIGQAISGFLTKVFGDVFGGLFKTAAQAPQVAAQVANTSALTANTAAVTALTTAVTSQGAAGAAAQAAGGVGGAGGAGGALAGLGGIGGAVTAISSAVTAVTGVLSYLQGRRMEQDIGRIEVTTRGMLNQLISLQGTLNNWLPPIADRTLGIWSEIMVTNDILRLMGQNGGGLGTGEHTGADPEMGAHIADIINSESGQVVDSMTAVVQSLDEGKQAYDNYNSGLQTTASSAYSLDEAVTRTTDSMLALHEATQGVNGALPGFVDGMDKAIFDSMNRVQGGPGQNLTPNGARSNMASVIMPVPIADALSGPGGLMQGAMLPQVNNPIQYGSIAPVVGGPGVTRGGTQPLITVEAVDPSGRQIARATVKGLEEMGIRTR